MTTSQKRVRRLLPLLKELCGKGMKAKEIKAHPKFANVYIGTIQRRMAKLGFADEVRSLRRKNGVRFTPEQHTEFTRFLDRNWKIYAITDLVRMWKQNMVPQGYPVPSWDTFRYWLRKLSRQHAPKDVYQLPFTHRRLTKHLRSVSQKNAVAGAGAREKRRSAALALNADLLKAVPRPESSPCRKCKTHWAHDPRFWEKLRGDLLLFECRFCRHEHRTAVARAAPEKRKDLQQARKLELWMVRFKAIDQRADSAADQLAKRRPKPKEHRVCIGFCGKKLPLESEFFISEKHKAGRKAPKTYYRYRCRFCEDRQRLLKEALRKGLVLPPELAAMQETIKPAG